MIMSKLHYLVSGYIDKYYPLFGPKMVGEKLGMKPESVTGYAKRNNLVLSKEQGIGEILPDFNNPTDFCKLFNNIDYRLAYWLGFMWADGCINHHCSMTIEILENDGMEISKQLQEIYPFTISTRKRPGKKSQMKIRVTDKKVGTLLESLGKYSKSSESHKKILDYLSDETLKKYFLRGLIDGDGNFYINEKEQYGQFTLVSNYYQDWNGMLDYLKLFNPHIHTGIRPNGKTSILRITGKDNMLKFIHFLEYDKNDIGLKRKINIALEIEKMYNETNSKKVAKHVFQYTKNMELIKEWKSTKEAADSLGVVKSAIANCVKGYSKTSCGYIWRYL